jgi:sugar lactone lactonase YvrE
MASNPILDFGIDKAAIQYLGSDLQRPECILAEPDGTLWAADARGGVARLNPDRTQRIITQKRSESFAGASSEASRYLEGTLPNGLAFAGNGDILISNFGTDCLEIMTREGETRVLADSIDGEAIGKVNFVLRDSKDRIWITISTRVKNWMHALRTDLADGYLARYEDGKFRIVADGFRFTNEIRFDAKEEFLYVVETTGGCVSRLRIDERGEPKDREIFGPTQLGKGAWPDGIAFDAFGNLWGTLVYSDKLFVLTPQGDLRVLLHRRLHRRQQDLRHLRDRRAVGGRVRAAQARLRAGAHGARVHSGPDDGGEPSPHHDDLVRGPFRVLHAPDLRGVPDRRGAAAARHRATLVAGEARGGHAGVNEECGSPPHDQG